MKRTIVILFIFFQVASFKNSNAQYLNADSLKQLIDKNYKQDCTYVRLLINYGLSIWNDNHDKGEKTIQNAIDLAENLKWKRAQVVALASLSTLKSSVQEFDIATTLGIKALKIAEEISDTGLLSTAHYALGTIYYFLDDQAKSMFHHKKCLEFAIAVKDEHGIMRANLEIAVDYFDQKKYTEGKNFADEAMKMAFVLNDDYVISKVLALKGQREYDIKNYRGAREYYQRVFLYNKLKNDHGGISYYASRLGIINSYLNKKDSAYYYGDIARREAEEFGLTKELGDAYESLYQISLNFKDSHKALSYYLIYDSIRYAKINSETTLKVEKTAAKHEQDKKDALANAEIRNQKIIRNFSFAIAFLILLFSGYSIYRYKKKKQLQNQQALMNERLRISRELHDEVGATLSGIAMYSHLTKEQIKNTNTTEVEKSLNIMQQSAGEMVNKLNDIVWLINPDQDSLQKLIQRLEEYARDMAAIKNMQVKVNVPEHLHEHSLPMESRRNIYLFCKEAINNAVKYSNGTLLEVNIKEVDNKLEFAVSDNGKGFDAVMVRRGNGLDNMQKRADEIGARLMLQSKQNEGCLVSMQLKIT